MKAYQVLEDCRTVWMRLEDSDEDSEFRVNWVTMVTLLRAVGHVLSKVDSRGDAALAKAIENRWDEWKTNREKYDLFWRFIDQERNSVLKLYEPSYNPDGVHYALYAGDPEDVFYAESGELHLGIPDGKLEESILESGVYRPILNGPFVWEDAKVVAKSAIDWWAIQLAEISAERASTA